MDYEDDEEDGNDDNEGGRELNGYTQALDLHAEHLEGSPEDNDESIGDEFDDFEEGAAADDFGDFDDGSQPLRNIEDLDSAASVQISHISLNPFVSCISSMHKIVLSYCSSYTQHISSS